MLAMCKACSGLHGAFILNRYLGLFVPLAHCTSARQMRPNRIYYTISIKSALNIINAPLPL